MKKDGSKKISINISRYNKESIGSVIVEIDENFNMKDYLLGIDMLVQKMKRSILEIVIENEVDKHSLDLEKNFDVQKRD